MKRLLSMLLILCVLFSGVGASAAGESVKMTYESDTYKLTFESAKVVEGALNIAISGFGNVMHMRNGKIVIPFWASAVIDGKTTRASSVSCNSSGVNTYVFNTKQMPEAVYLSADGDADHLVLLWSALGEPERSSMPEELCGKWRLNQISFLTPEKNNVFSIDAGLTMGADTKKGNMLTLNADGSIISDVDIDGLVAALSELPFETSGLNFGAYSSWEIDDDALLLSPDGAALEWSYDKAADALSIKWSDKVNILSQKTAQGTTASGIVQMAITLTFLRGETAQATVEPTAEPTSDPPENPAKAVLSSLNEPLMEAAYEYLSAGNYIRKGENSDYGRGLQTLLKALGQDIAVNGRMEAKTIAAMNKVRTSLGMEENDMIGAPCFERLLMCLLCLRDEAAAYDLLVDSSVITQDEMTYLRACGFELTGQYYKAYQTFCQTEWEDANPRAETCVQSWPKNGEIYRNDDYPGKKTYLHIKIDSQDAGQAALIKIYAENGDHVSSLFIGGAGKVTAKIPGGTYTVKMGVGESWFGAEDAFGKEGYYETMLFDGGADSVTLKPGYEYTLTINTSVSDPNADGVGSEYEEYEAF